MYEYKISNILKIVDGDTVDLSLDLGFYVTVVQRIRLDGLDTPEVHSKDMQEKTLAQEAKEFVTKWFEENKELTIRTKKEDKYGRILGEIYCQDRCLNKDLVDMGYAWEYDGTKKNKDVSILLERRKLWMQ
jgi:micrococcal nuclease